VPQTTSNEKAIWLGPLTLADYLLQMEAFHGSRSPGMLMGGFMVDLALRKLSPTPHLNVVTETTVCLPDAVQLLTPCTMGNGFLQVLDWGKFALTAYDRMSLAGIRVGIDADAVKSCPMIGNWFFRTEPALPKPPFEDFAAEVLVAGQQLFSFRSVRLRKALKPTERFPTERCGQCGEFYALRFGTVCPSCQGNAYFL
jgi:formylmethanofuran dehydrogenase subunit E